MKQIGSDYDGIGGSMFMDGVARIGLSLLTDDEDHIIRRAAEDIISKGGKDLPTIQLSCAWAESLPTLHNLAISMLISRA